MSATADHHHHSIMPEDWPENEHYAKATPGKLAMWFFLCSDLMSFSGLLLAYGLLRGGSDNWIPEGAPELGINFTAGLTFLLICSSVTMVMAYAAVVEKDRKGALKWLGITVIGGALFLCGQAQEYFGTFEAIFHHEGLIREGLLFGTTHYANTFYIITSFHGAHVLTGVIYLAIIWIQLARGKYDDGNYNNIEIAGLFWHFVDLVWIIVFTVVYLIPN